MSHIYHTDFLKEFSGFQVLKPLNETRELSRPPYYSASKLNTKNLSYTYFLLIEGAMTTMLVIPLIVHNTNCTGKVDKNLEHKISDNTESPP